MKKILALCLVMVLAATAVTGATLAYFTDKDAATNVMTLGNIDIEQNEKDKEGNNFVQEQGLYPAVFPEGLNEKNIKQDGWFNPGMKNVIDKVVTVTNVDDKLPAYVRTILAFETVRSYKEGSSTEFVDLHDHFFLVNTDGVTYTKEYITIDGVEYVLAYKVYKDALAPGKTSTPSLKQFCVTPEAGNEINEWFDDEYTILAISQGVQTEGFGSAEEALNKAFGEINAANAQSWFTAAP